ncbi:MAG: pyridoxamine 5'-phosphate oxidase family protein [Acidobacteriaceae bacterium]
MSSSQARQHASGVSDSPQRTEPSYAERVRTLLSTASTATLSTLSRRHAGFPFGSLMPFALDDAGRPLLLISSMAVHTRNLSSDPRCSLFVAQENAEGDPLGAARHASRFLRTRSVG